MPLRLAPRRLLLASQLWSLERKLCCRDRNNKNKPNPDFFEELDHETSPPGDIVPGMEPSFFQPLWAAHE